MFRVFVLILCFGLAGCSERTLPAFRNTDIGGAEVGRSLALKNHHGKPTSLADFQGKAVVIFFGYTSCPDVCPKPLARFAEVMKQLGSDAEHVQVLLDVYKRQAVHRGELVKDAGLDILQARLEQFGTDQHGQCTGEEKHEQAEPQVQGSDVLVVGACLLYTSRCV